MRLQKREGLWHKDVAMHDLSTSPMYCPLYKQISCLFASGCFVSVLLRACLRLSELFYQAKQLIWQAFLSAKEEKEAFSVLGDLGEVLMTSGAKKDAESILRSALRNENLSTVVRKQGCLCSTPGGHARSSLFALLISWFESKCVRHRFIVI